MFEAHRQPLEEAMAYLVCMQDKSRHYLKAYHVFGRLESSANTLIRSPEISKIHAVLEWDTQGWLLTDFSSNGIWLNSNKIAKNTATSIKKGDSIYFAAKSSNQFVLKDDSPPCDLLVPLENSQIIDAIELKPYCLLPNEESPTLCLFYDDATEHWFMEELLGEANEPRVLNHNDVIKFDGISWQLKVDLKLAQTVRLAPAISSLKELSFIFNTSADEEATRLTLKASDQLIDLNIRSHHYLTLILARKRIEDMKSGITDTEQGWMYAEQLSKDLGVDQCHMNIQVHRARKQFSECLNNSQLTQLFERHSGRIRLGCNHITINKGGRQEFS